MKQSALLFLAFTSFLSAKTYTLNEAISTALINNQKHNISAQDIAIAKAKYNQALSINYPTLDISIMANRRDEAFIDEVHTNFQLPPAMGGISLPVNYTHTISGRDTAIAKIQTQYALYSGGKISAIQKQAKAGIQYANEQNKLTDDEIVRDVKKYYATVILSKNLERLMQKTVDEMKATFDLTEAFYKGESLKVKKTDYLRAKMTLLNMQSILLSMKNSTQLAIGALTFEMGLKEHDNIKIKNTNLQTIHLPKNLEECYTQLYINNHQLKQLKIALHVKNAQEEEAKSEYLPSVGLYANAQNLYSNEDGGIINDQNKHAWNIGIALKYNLFNGGATTAKIEEAKSQKLKLKAQRAYLQTGLSLQTKNAYLKAKTALKQLKIMQEAVKTAQENSELNFRAYSEELVDTKDILEAQFIRSLTEVAYYKTLYQAQVEKANLDYLIGKSIK